MKKEILPPGSRVRHRTGAGFPALVVAIHGLESPCHLADGFRIATSAMLQHNIAALDDHFPAPGFLGSCSKQ